MPDNAFFLKLAEDIGEIKASLEAQTQRQEFLEHKLLGNGQPGIIKEFHERITRLENWRYWLAGAAIAIGAFAHTVANMMGLKL